ncbi:lamin tail domain-containing protein [candidate division WOR-3 bacterium]|nr:lamin tail domain-containing protein [candidate division WOR-3 bacterium]
MELFFLLISMVCINEVMSNPLGSDGAAGSPEDRNEFIEIFNHGVDAVDLHNWKITDFDAVDYIIPFTALSGDSGTSIPSGGFALIMDPEYVDSGENYMPYGVPSCLLLRPANTTIGNGLTNNDSIALISPEGDTVSTYYHPFNAGNGVSVERVSPSIPDIPENWGCSRDTTGSTPGFINSIYSPPDFSLDTLYVAGRRVNVWIENTADTMLSGTISIFDDEDRDREMDLGELLISRSLLNISQDSIVKIQFIIEEEGVYLLGFNFLHKTIFRRIRIGKGISSLVLNEIMFAPEESVEWIELYNRSHYDYYLESFWVDGNLLSKGIHVPGGGYLVIAADSSRFYAYYGNIPAPLLTVGLSLSNSGDTVCVLDENRFLIDECVYSAGATERNFTLERVSPNIESENSSNWGQSIMSGGTPGDRNSIFAEYKSEEVGLLVTPRHFAPDGNGLDESCVISFRLPYMRNDVTVRIYDRRAHLLREKKGVYGGDRGEWVWDGKNNRGNVVNTGLYVVFLSVKDCDSNTSSYKKTVVSVGR